MTASSPACPWAATIPAWTTCCWPAPPKPRAQPTSMRSQRHWKTRSPESAAASAHAVEQNNPRPPGRGFFLFRDTDGGKNLRTLAISTHRWPDFSAPGKLRRGPPESVVGCRRSTRAQSRATSSRQCQRNAIPVNTAFFFQRREFSSAMRGALSVPTPTQSATPAGAAPKIFLQNG